VLQHLRVEENPILKMPHLEAASILLLGPTFKKFNDRGISVLLLASLRYYLTFFFFFFFSYEPLLILLGVILPL
jgi:hypothetical protein